MAGLDPVRLERAAALCQGYVDSGQMPCTSLLVARHGEIAMRRDYGLMDVAEGKPLVEDALFRIFSMTKPLTCIAGLVCYEMGCFQLDDPVSLYLPEFNEHDDPAAPLTIEHCFTHTNGLQDTTGNTPTSLAEKVAQLAASPLLFPPGSAWKYGPGHDVIGRLTEVFTGMPYADFLREAVLAPTGMEDTSFVVPGERDVPDDGYRASLGCVLTPMALLQRRSGVGWWRRASTSRRRRAACTTGRTRSSTRAPTAASGPWSRATAWSARTPSPAAG